MDRTKVDLDIPHSAEERVAATSKRVKSVATQIASAIRFQREIIMMAEKEIQRLHSLYVHDKETP